MISGSTQQAELIRRVAFGSAGIDDDDLGLWNEKGLYNIAHVFAPPLPCKLRLAPCTHVRMLFAFPSVHVVALPSAVFS